MATASVTAATPLPVADALPSARQQLPIRVAECFYRGVKSFQLSYAGQAPGMLRKELPYRYPGSPQPLFPCPNDYVDPLAAAVLQTLRLFWDLETRLDTLQRERDEAREQLAVLRRENERLEALAAGKPPPHKRRDGRGV